MKKIILLILISTTFNAFGQVTSPLLKCSSVQSNFFPFEAKFDGTNAQVTFKGWSHNLKYDRAFISTSGERWSTYVNAELELSTTFPYDKYVSIRTLGTGPVGTIISSAHCN
jgi:hypothetical protein